VREPRCLPAAMPDAAAIYTAAFPSRKVLLVVTSVDSYPDGESTGFYLSEVVHPYNKFIAAGWTVDIASPTGTAQCDPGSVADGAPGFDEEVKAFWEDSEKKALTETPKKLADIPPEEAEAYDVLFFAGGFGCMWDLAESVETQALVKSMYEAGKVVAGVCHGVVAFVNVTLSDESKLLAGKNVTGFTNAEEKVMGKLEVVGGTCTGTCEDAMDAAGAIFKDGTEWAPCAVVDGNLMTGQNPQSAGPLAVQILYFFDKIRAEFEPEREALLAERATLASQIVAAGEAFETELATLKKQEAKGQPVAEKIEELLTKATAGRDYRAFCLANLDSQLERNALLRQKKVDEALAKAAAEMEPEE